MITNTISVHHELRSVTYFINAMQNERNRKRKVTVKQNKRKEAKKNVREAKGKIEETKKRREE